MAVIGHLKVANIGHIAPQPVFVLTCTQWCFKSLSGPLISCGVHHRSRPESGQFCMTWSSWHEKTLGALAHRIYQNAQATGVHLLPEE
jgi:hypothetical protein